MSRMFQNWIVSPTTEIIAMGVLGMCFTALEDSFFNIKGLLSEIWSMTLPENQFSPNLQYAIKTILSAVVVARTYTVHVYFLTYILLIYVAFFEERPRLLMPWLALGAVRNLILDSLAIGTGVFICVWSAGMTPVCMEFLARKSLKLAISFYLWRSVLKLYWELYETKGSSGSPSPTDSLLELELAARRRKARSLPDDYEGKSSWLSIFPEPHISVSDDDELTLTSAPSRGKLKLSRSLDNMMSQLDFDIDMIESLAARRKEEKVCDFDADLAERAVCFLRLSPSEIDRAKKNKGTRVWDSDGEEFKEIEPEEKEQVKQKEVEKEEKADNINKRLRIRSDHDLAMIDSTMQTNAISERVLKKISRAEINRLKVDTVDVGIQVNTLSRKWLNSQSSIKLHHGTRESIPTKVSAGIIGGTYNVSAQSNMPYCMSDIAGIKTPERSSSTVHDDLRLRKRMSKKSVSFLSETPSIQVIPTLPLEKRSKSQAVIDDPEERKMAAKPPIPPKKSSVTLLSSVDHTNGDEKPLQYVELHDVRSMKSLTSIQETVEYSNDELKNIEELSSANLSADSISLTGELTSSEQISEKPVQDPSIAAPKEILGSVTATAERTSGDEKSEKQVQDPSIAAPKETLGSVSATVERADGEHKSLRKVHDHPSSLPKKNVGSVSATVERTSGEQKSLKSTHGPASSLPKKYLGSVSTTVERISGEHKPLKKTLDHPSAVPRRTIRSVSPTVDHTSAERKSLKKIEKPPIATKPLRATSPSGTKQKG